MGQMIYKHSQEQKRNGKLYLAENHYLQSEVRPNYEDYTGTNSKKYLPNRGPWAKTVRAVPLNLKSV